MFSVRGWSHRNATEIRSHRKKNSCGMMSNAMAREKNCLFTFLLVFLKPRRSYSNKHKISNRNSIFILRAEENSEFSKRLWDKKRISNKRNAQKNKRIMLNCTFLAFILFPDEGVFCKEWRKKTFLDFAFSLSSSSTQREISKKDNSGSWASWKLFFD